MTESNNISTKVAPTYKRITIELTTNDYARLKKLKEQFSDMSLADAIRYCIFDVFSRRKL